MLIGLGRRIAALGADAMILLEACWLITKLLFTCIGADAMGGGDPVVGLCYEYVVELLQV